MANRALLIGINTYPGAPLRGCVNDSLDFAELLTSKRYKFKPKNIRLINDSRATTRAIKKRLHWLTETGPGDIAFLLTSGHGTRVAPRNRYTHEVDGLLEVFCPVDFRWHPNYMITDKYFNRFFGKKIKKGVKFYWVSDCCHSGDLTREIPPPSDEDSLLEKRYPVPFDLRWRQVVARSEKIRCSRAYVHGDLDVGFVSACRYDQTAADTFDKNGRPCGALSLYFLKALKKLPRDTPLNEMVRAARRALKRDGYSQRPQVEGARRKMSFLA
jgi:hypothetical protein